MVNEDTLFSLTDELMLEAQEDNWDLVKHLERNGYAAADLYSEAQSILSQKPIDWSRLFLVTVLGVSLNDR